MANFDDLEFIRLTRPEQFSLIPTELFEQIKSSSYKVNRLYQFGVVLLASPFTYLFVLADRKTHKIKGVLWSEVNPLSEKMTVFIFSLSREYQQKDGLFTKGSKPIEKTVEFLRKIQESIGITGKIEMGTQKPKAYERAGWQRSKKIIMEI